MKMGRSCATHRRTKCKECGKSVAVGWMSRHRCGEMLTSSLKELSLEERMKQIQYCLIRAKVDLEYYMGFSRNEYLLSCKKEILQAIEYAFADKQ